MAKKQVYVYVCSVGHEERMTRPFPYHIVGCQAMVAVGSWDYTQCGLWCWPKVEKDASREDA
jgi:hypothetical protein